MLKLANNCYSLGLIVVSDKQEEYAALALFAITGVIAVLSLWLYEKEEKCGFRHCHHSACFVFRLR